MPKLTVHEASKVRSGVVKREAIVRTFEENSALLRNIPFMDIAGDTYTYNVEDQLPNVGFRGYNEGFNTAVGVLNPQTEVLKLVGSDIDVDRRLVRTRGPAVRAMQEQMVTRSIALKISDSFINGDSASDPREFDGLRKRIIGNQLIPANLGAPNANSPLSLQALMKAIDEVINPTGLVMSKDMARAISTAAQQNLGGDITIDKDQFGFRVTLFNGIPIWAVDYDNQGKKIIDFNEAGPAGGTTNTSIYVVSTGPNGLLGLQNGGILIDDLGELDAMPVYRTRVEWQLGMAVLHGRAVARVWGVTNAAVTA